MSITVDLPPAMEHEIREYVEVQGTTLGEFVAAYLRRELERIKRADELMAKLDGLVKKTSGRLSSPYKFNRADAYEPEVPYA